MGGRQQVAKTNRRKLIKSKEISEIVGVIHSLHQDAKERGLFFQFIEDQKISNRDMQLHGQEVVTFGSCSYLGLELHPKMIDHQRVSYCGAYWGNGFHEDGVNSALAIVERLGGQSGSKS